MKGIWISVTKLPFGGAAIALFPFVFYKQHCDSVHIRQHERTHLYQQLEMLVLPFYIWYLVEFCLRRIQYNSWYLAYRNISFEREVYSNDRKENYLRNRKIYSWIKYMVL